MGHDTLTIADVMLGTRWFRSAVAWQHPEFGISTGFGVDRVNRVIHGVAVVTKGEALGHDLLLDETFLDAVVEQGNRTKTGVKSRFDHPNASGTSMGSMLGRVKQLRRDGDVVRGDLHLLESASKTPDGDLAGYVMDLAEEDPQAFGASIVFSGDSLEQKDETGKAIPDVPKLARLKKLMAADVVDNPAANPGGMFSVEDSLAAKMTEFLDRYFASKQKENAMTQTKDQEAAELDKAELDSTRCFTSAALASSQPELWKEVHAEGFAAGIAEERGRILGIQSAMFSGQDALAKDMIAAGTTVDEAKGKFIDNEKLANKARLEQLKAAAPKSAGGGEDITVPEALSGLPDEQRWEKEYQRSSALQAEFPTVGAYQAFQAAEARGLVKILKK